MTPEEARRANDLSKLGFLKERYSAACHAMQSGVRGMMDVEADHQQKDPMTWTHSPKHLRVGVNSALVDNAALANSRLTKTCIDLLRVAQLHALAGAKNQIQRTHKFAAATLGIKFENEDSTDL
jgi:hypothetical protein